MVVVLLACTPGPSSPLELPITPIAAEHASALSPWSVIGPTSAQAVSSFTADDREVLCAGTDDAARERLLTAGLVDWRVVVISPAGVAVPPGATVPIDPVDAPWKPDQSGNPSVRSAADRWFAADVALAAACGRRVDTHVLVAVDDATVSSAVMAALFSLAKAGMEPDDIALLVSDPTPDAAFPATTPYATRLVTFLYSTDGWVVLDHEHDPERVSDVAVAARRFAVAGDCTLMVSSAPNMPWTQTIAGLDAIAAVGVRAPLAFRVGLPDSPPPASPSSVTHTAKRGLTLNPDAPIAVLRPGGVPRFLQEHSDDDTIDRTVPDEVQRP